METNKLIPAFLFIQAVCQKLHSNVQSLCKSFAQGKTFGRRIYVYIDKMIDMISQSLEICNLYLVIFAFLALKSSRHH